MAHKTFISYKYSESQDVRDRIIKALGEDGMYYQGETSDSPDLSDTTTDNIKKNLSDMMYSTSVTIVVISPHMKESKWIDWEIEYSLKFETRNDRTSHTNGLVGVIQKVNGDYSWFKNLVRNSDGCNSFNYNEQTYCYPIITENRYNQNPKKYSCEKCKSVDSSTGSYLSYVTEEDFLSAPNWYIENAYDKSQNDAVGYDLQKTR